MVKKPQNNKPQIWSDKMDKQLKLGNGMKFGSQNIRTLNTLGALQYVLNTINSHKI